jgi:hypothetical protein
MAAAKESCSEEVADGEAEEEEAAPAGFGV